MGKQKDSAAAIGRELGLSRSSMSKYKQAGMPVDSVEAARAWRERHVKLTAHGMSSRAMRKPSSPQTHHATLAPAQLSQPTATSSAAQHARALMEIAGAALASGRSIEAMTPDLRAALAAVDEEHRCTVQLDADVMDYLTESVRAAIDDDDGQSEEAHYPGHTDDGPDMFAGVDMANFWYRAAAGEIVATPRPVDLAPMTAKGEHLIELLRRAQNDLDSELHVHNLAIDIYQALDAMPPGDRAHLQICGVNVWALLLVMSSWALDGHLMARS